MLIASGWLGPAPVGSGISTAPYGAFRQSGHHHNVACFQHAASIEGRFCALLSLLQAVTCSFARMWPGKPFR